jgi:hypothetical protein
MLHWHYSRVWLNTSFRVDSHYTTRHNTTRQDKIFLYGFHMLEFTLPTGSDTDRHRQCRLDWKKKRMFCLSVSVAACRCLVFWNTRRQGSTEQAAGRFTSSVLKYSVIHFSNELWTLRNLSSLFENTVNCMICRRASTVTIYIKKQSGRSLRKNSKAIQAKSLNKSCLNI